MSLEIHFNNLTVIYENHFKCGYILCFHSFIHSQRLKNWYEFSLKKMDFGCTVSTIKCNKIVRKYTPTYGYMVLTTKKPTTNKV